MRIAIIGAGSIGGATAFGLKAAGFDDMVVTARHETTLEKFSAKGIETSLDNKKAVQGADVIVFAVKPWLMESVVTDALSEEALSNDRILVSMAPGITAEQFKSWTEGKGASAYVIPNTAIEIGQSMTFIAPIDAAAEKIAVLEAVFGKVGGTLVVAPDKLRAGTALASCGIAYALRYIRAASEGGVQLGFFAEDAAKVVAQTVKGAAAILEAHGTHPEQEIDKVTTPGGMTIKGLNAMEEAGFTNSVIKGLKGCLE